MIHRSYVLATALTIIQFASFSLAQSTNIQTNIVPGCEVSSPTLNDGGYYFLTGKEGWLFESGEFAYPAKFDASNYLRRFIESLRYRGIEIVFVPVPRRPYKYSSEINFSNYPKMEYSAAKYRDIWEDMVKTTKLAGANTVNLLPSIDDYAKGLYNEPYFHKAEHHWTTSGAASAAKATATVIDSVIVRRLISAEKSNYTLSLTRFTDFEGQYQKHYKERCGKTVDSQIKREFEVNKNSEDVGLLDDAQPQLALFGDSFGLGEVDNGFAPLIQYHSGLDTVNYAIPGREISSMIGYMADQKKIDSMPKIIVLVAWDLISSDTLFYRQMIPALKGGCKNIIPESSAIYSDKDKIIYDPPAGNKISGPYFLSFNFNDADVSEFNLSIKYFGGTEEKARLYRPTRGFYNYSGDLSHYYLEVDQPISSMSLQISDGSKPKNTEISACKY